MVRQCKVCNKYFSVEDPADPRMMCSKECQNQWNTRDEIWDLDKVGICKYCGKKFFKNTSNKIYCDSKCRREASYDKKKRLKNSTEEQADPKCVICGKSLTSIGKALHNRKYCSAECRELGKKQRLQNRRNQLTHVYEDSTVESQTTTTEKLKGVTPEVKKKVSGANKKVPKASKQADSTVSISEIKEAISHRQRAMSASEEMEAWYASKRARKKWKKTPLEEADAICKQYGLTYPQYQYMKYEGTLEAYIKAHPKHDN